MSWLRDFQGIRPAHPETERFESGLRFVKFSQGIRGQKRDSIDPREVDGRLNPSPERFDRAFEVGASPAAGMLAGHDHESATGNAIAVVIAHELWGRTRRVDNP